MKQATYFSLFLQWTLHCQKKSHYVKRLTSLICLGLFSSSFFFTFFQEPQSFDEFRCKFCEFSGEWKSNSLLFWFVAKLLEDFCKCCFGSFWFLCEAYGSSLVFPLSPFKPAVMFCEEISKLCLISIFPPSYKRSWVWQFVLNFASFCCHDWMVSYTCWVSSGRDVTKYKYLISVLLLYCFTACI